MLFIIVVVAKEMVDGRRWVGEACKSLNVELHSYVVY